MAQDMNFATSTRSPLDRALEGFQKGFAFRQMQRQQSQQAEQVRQKQQAFQVLQDDMYNLSQNPNPTAKDFGQMMVKHPQLSEHFKRSFEVMNTDQKRNKVNQLSQVYGSLKSGNVEQAKELLEEQRLAATNSGLIEEAKGAEAMLKQIEFSPEAGMTSAALALSAAVGPKEFSKTFEQLGGKQKGFRPLDQSEKKELGLDPQGAFQIGTDGKISSIGGGGVNVQVGDDGKFGTIPPGFMIVKDKESGAITMELIPGGPAETKAKELAKKETLQEEKEEVQRSVILDDITGALDIIDTSKLPVSGLVSKKIPFNQPKADLESKIESIAGAIAIDTLIDLKKASPTGGALGAINQSELRLLKAGLGALDLDQSEKQLRKNLIRVQKLFNKVNKKIEKAGFSYNDGNIVSAGEVQGETVDEAQVQSILDKYK